MTDDDEDDRPDKKPGCGHQWEGEPKCQPAFRNEYHCEECDVSWDDEWSAECNDKCPVCNHEIEPERSTEVASCACDYLGE